MRMRNLSILLILILFACGRREKTKDTALDVTPPVRVVEVKRGNLTEYYGVNTKLKLRVGAQVYPEVPGRFIGFLVKEGVRVKKDDVIAELEREITGLSFERVKVRSPIDGRVHLKDLSYGQFVSPQMVICEIYREDTLEFKLNIPERFLGRVLEGERVRIITEIDTFYGVIDYVSTKVSELTGTQEVRGYLLKRRGIIPGMSVKVQIPVERRDSVLILPKEAIRGEALKYVWVYKNGVVNKKLIKEGLYSDGLVEVSGELQEGDSVVLLGPSLMYDGMRVKVVE